MGSLLWRCVVKGAGAADLGERALYVVLTCAGFRCSPNCSLQHTSWLLDPCGARRNDLARVYQISRRAVRRLQCCVAQAYLRFQEGRLDGALRSMLALLERRLALL